MSFDQNPKSIHVAWQKRTGTTTTALSPKNQLQSLNIITATIMTDKETSAAADTAAASTANPPSAPAAEAIEEDDEFEEFEPCHWDKRDEDAEDSQQWQVSYSSQ